ncbi:MAG: hypothetical protein QXP31_10045 [Pyrobaculum sp.]
MGRGAPCLWCSAGADAVVIGATALEIFGLEVELVRGVLKETELLLL